jgi:hypothetical protein
MKKYFLITVITSLLISSCGATKYTSNLTRETFQDSNCPDFKIEHNRSASIQKINIQEVDILPIFYDISLKSVENDSVSIEKEALTKRIESIIYSSLENQNIKFTSYSFSGLSEKDINDYKHSIRRSSFAFAHNQYVPEDYYTEVINNLGTSKYKLAFFFQFFPKNNGLFERIYVHVMVYDVDINKNVYYEYLIYENCSVRYLDNFTKVINTVVTNFKDRNYKTDI